MKTILSKNLLWILLLFLGIISCKKTDVINKPDTNRTEIAGESNDSIKIGNKLEIINDPTKSIPAADVNLKFGNELIAKFQTGLSVHFKNENNIIKKKVEYFNSYRLDPKTLQFFFENNKNVLGSEGLRFTLVEINKSNYNNIIDYSNLSSNDNDTCLYIIISYAHPSHQSYKVDENYISFNLKSGTNPIKLKDSDFKKILLEFKKSSMKVFDNYYCRIDDELNLSSNTRSIIYYWKDLEELMKKSESSNSIDFQFAEIIDVEGFLTRNPTLLVGKEDLYRKFFKGRNDQLTLLGKINFDIISKKKQPSIGYFDMGDLRP